MYTCTCISVLTYNEPPKGTLYQLVVLYNLKESLSLSRKKYSLVFEICHLSKRCYIVLYIIRVLSNSYLYSYYSHISLIRVVGSILILLIEDPMHALNQLVSIIILYVHVYHIMSSLPSCVAPSSTGHRSTAVKSKVLLKRRNLILAILVSAIYKLCILVIFEYYLDFLHVLNASL